MRTASHSLIVENADEAVIFVDIRTAFREKDCRAACIKKLDEISALFDVGATGKIGATKTLDATKASNSEAGATSGAGTDSSAGETKADGTTSVTKSFSNAYNTIKARHIVSVFISTT